MTNILKVKEQDRDDDNLASLHHFVFVTHFSFYW